MIEKLGLINSDIIFNSIRILILISKFESTKSFELNIDKIMYFDFYLKFPKTMIGNERISELTNYNFDEYYSHYHWKPDMDKYNVFIRFLLAKSLINRVILNNKFCYRINSKGKSFLKNLDSNYAKKVDFIAKYIKSDISKLSNKKIEKQIIDKSVKIRDKEYLSEVLFNDSED
jgi:hypothetical protein